MFWQQAVAAGNLKSAGMLARTGLRDLKKMEQDFARLWPHRNKATPKHSTPFLRWRMEDYRRGLRTLRKPRVAATPRRKK
jgi:hypothetical protein